jgi:hypothetical protein
MKLRGFLTALVILGALAGPAATSSAQEPAAPTAFDGKYVGTGTLMHGAGGCNSIRSVDMTITGGQVVIHEIHFDGAGPVYRGSVNAAGEVSASRQSKAIATDGQNFFIVSGIIKDKVFTGQRLRGTASRGCSYSFEMASTPLPTRPFDGDYRGVSGEVSDSGSNEHGCYPHALTPPAPLTITNGVVRTPGRQWWEGTVNPQGTVVIHNPKWNRVDARVDSQGTIRGQYGGEFPPDLLAQIGGDSTNCIIKFV